MECMTDMIGLELEDTIRIDYVYSTNKIVSYLMCEQHFNSMNPKLIGSYFCMIQLKFPNQLDFVASQNYHHHDSYEIYFLCLIDCGGGINRHYLCIL